MSKCKDCFQIIGNDKDGYVEWMKQTNIKKKLKKLRQLEILRGARWLNEYRRNDCKRKN